MTRHIVSEPDIHPAVRDKIAGYHRDIVEHVQAAIAAHDVVVVGMAQNPNPARALRYLKGKGVTPHYIQYGSYLSEWRRRLALKMWTGWPTFPMVWIKGTFVGGADDVQRLGESGELDKLLGR